MQMQRSLRRPALSKRQALEASTPRVACPARAQCLNPWTIVARASADHPQSSKQVTRGRRPASERPRRRTAGRRGVAAQYSAEQTLAPARAAPATAHGQHSRLRVAVDVDEVLGQFVFALNQFCLHKYQMNHQVSDYWIYEFAKIWNCDQDRSNHIVHEFFKSSHFTQGIPVMPGAAQSLQRLSTYCDLVVVTSRQHVIQDQTLAWLDEHFPGTFQDVYFGNHWSLEGVSRKKSDICKSIGAGVLIDDNPTYAMECAQAGIHVLLYDWNNAYPWSKLNGRRHPLIRIVQDWADVEAALAELTPQLTQAEALAPGQATIVQANGSAPLQ